MTIHPYPPLPDVTREGIDLAVRVSYGGIWIELNDHLSCTVADGSFAEEAVTLRRQTATNPFLEGEDTVQALRGNIIRPLNIWVAGASHFDMYAVLEDLKSAFLQRHYQVIRTLENAQETFDCYASDFSVSCDRPLLHARMAQLKVQLVTAPGTSIVEVL